MLDIFKNPKRYSKFFAGLLGSVITWAVATFPESRDVQVYGSLVSALITGASVYQLENKK